MENKPDTAPAPPPDFCENCGCVVVLTPAGECVWCANPEATERLLELLR